MNNLKYSKSLLRENIALIHSVAEWAQKMGYQEREKFSLHFREVFGQRPKEVFIEVKLEEITRYLRDYPSEKNYCVALEFGFKDEKELYKFIKRHLKCTPTELRKRLMVKANAKG
ncbi:MAG: helix-turn-helix domain-containing protein [Bacteroidota bacterium]